MKYNRFKAQSIDLIGLLQRKNKPKAGTVDYSYNSFCAKCQEKKVKEQIYCDYCGRKLRHNPLNKKARYWETRLKYY